MTRVVRGADGRMWTVRSGVEWSEPVTEETFEHDVGSGRIAGVLMAGILLALVIFLIAWRAPSVRVPGLLVLALLALVLFFPARWLIRRPFRLVAETPGGLEEPAEKWVGRVRGYMTARQETTRAAKHLEVYAVPDREGDGPLQPVN
jgi:hypothetical protein